MQSQRRLEVGDFLGKLGICAIFATGAALKLRKIFQTLNDWSSSTASETKLLTVLSDAASLIFLTLVIAVAFFRLRPVNSAAGFEPRFTALAGTFLLVSLGVLPAAETPPVLVTLLGLSCIVVGSLLSAYVLSWLGRSFSIMAEARKLITGGPYSIVRHPLYLTEGIAMIGMVLLHWSLLAVLLGLIQTALQLRRIHNEEKILREAFPEYAAYAERTPRLVPAIMTPGRLL